AKDMELKACSDESTSRHMGKVGHELLDGRNVGVMQTRTVLLRPDAARRPTSALAPLVGTGVEQARLRSRCSVCGEVRPHRLVLGADRCQDQLGIADAGRLLVQDLATGARV